MPAVDVDNGRAHDVGQVYRGEDDDGTDAIIAITLTEEDEIIFAWGTGSERISLFVPADRVKQLLKNG